MCDKDRKKKRRKRKKCFPCIVNDPVQKQEVNIKIVVVDKEEEEEDGKEEDHDG